MNLLFTAIVVMFSTSFAISACSKEEHLVPKHGIEPKLSSTKRDSADIEMILKALMAKLSHIEESGLMQKKFNANKERYSYQPEMSDKFHVASMKESELKHMQEKIIPLARDEYEMKTFSSEKAHLFKEPVLDKSHKIHDSVRKDKFSDKDVSLAESLYHMKMAGDIETYPHIKMAPLTAEHNKKITDEKLHFEDDHSLHTDEVYLKKVDEMGKSLLIDESLPHLKDDNIEGYLKKAVAEDKSLLYDPKIIHTDSTFKSAEDKALEEWKASHKDIFAIEGGIFADEKLKKEGAHHVEGVYEDELMKKLKSPGLDKELKMEGAHHLEEAIVHDDELLKKFKSLGLDKELKMEGAHLEGAIVHEEELMKKLKSLGLDKELKMEGAHHLEGGIGHDEELMKKLKSLGLDKELKMEGPHHLEGAIFHEEELMKMLKSLGLDKEMKLDGAHHVEEVYEDELMKKLKSLGLDKELKMEGTHHLEEAIVPEEELLKKLKSLGLDKEMKMEGAHHSEEAIVHDEELLKKFKSLGLDKELKMEVPHLEGAIIHEEELIKKLKSLGLDKELKMEGAHHLEGAIGYDEELMKKLKSLGLDKELKMEGPHHLEGAIFHEEELLKKLKSLGLDKELKMEGAHHLEGGIAHEMNDELMKKMKDSLGLVKPHDEMFHLPKELHKEESIDEGSFAYEKAKEQVHKDVHAHLGEEELKKHMDEALSFGAKEKIHGTELMFEKGLANEKSHGLDKSLHGIHADETLKGTKTHAFDKSFDFEMDEAMLGGKVPLEGEVKHAIAHGSSFAAEADKAFKVHDDELLKKEMTYGADSLFHKDKEIMLSGEHHILKDEDAHILHDSEIEEPHVEGGLEKGRKILHDLKAKFFELLRRVLHMRKCHLVTMRPGELLGIVNCISKSKNPLLCEKFAMCEKKMPIRVIMALEKCQKEVIPGEIKRCTSYAPLYPSREIPLKIFQCVAINVRELIPQEKKQMADFEECARVVKAEGCGRFKWFRGPH